MQVFLGGIPAPFTSLASSPPTLICKRKGVIIIFFSYRDPYSSLYAVGFRSPYSFSKVDQNNFSLPLFMVLFCLANTFFPIIHREALAGSISVSQMPKKRPVCQSWPRWASRATTFSIVLNLLPVGQIKPHCSPNS